MVAKVVGAIPVLAALDVLETARFWERTLDFTVRHIGEEVAILARDEVILYVCAVKYQVVPDNTQAWLRVRDLDELYGEWVENVPVGFANTDGPALTELQDNPWGREFALRDPAGNCVHFVDVS